MNDSVTIELIRVIVPFTVALVPVATLVLQILTKRKVVEVLHEVNSKASLTAAALAAQTEEVSRLKQALVREGRSQQPLLVLTPAPAEHPEEDSK